jgi:hypothetical protein
MPFTSWFLPLNENDRAITRGPGTLFPTDEASSVRHYPAAGGSKPGKVDAGRAVAAVVDVGIDTQAGDDDFLEILGHLLGGGQRREEHG